MAHNLIDSAHGTNEILFNMDTAIDHIFGAENYILLCGKDKCYPGYRNSELNLLY